MDKTELIKRIKQAADYYREGRTYEAFQLIAPLHQRIQHEKVQKLYSASRKKALNNFKTLLDEKRYSRILELHETFLSGIDDPDFEILVMTAREEMQKTENAPLEITPEDIDPALEDPITEVISASWAAGVVSDDTQSDISSEEKEADLSPAPETTEPDNPPREDSAIREFEEIGMSDETDVNELIQRGVSLYEVGDVENALRIWRNGLRFDPENVILKEYIANASRELEEEMETTTPPAPSAEPEPPTIGTGPDPSELSRIIAMARAGDVDQALNALDILEKQSGSSPKLRESREYILKLSRQYGISTISAKVEELLASHRAGDAVQILEEHLKEHPEHLELKDLLETARRRMSDEPPSLDGALELDFGAKNLDTGPAKPARPVRPPQEFATPPRKKGRQRPVIMTKRKNYLLPATIVGGILVTLGLIAYFLIPQIRLHQFYNKFRKEMKPKTEMNRGESALKKKQEKEYQLTTTRAKEFYNEHRYLFSYYLLLHADSIHPLSPEDKQFLNAAKNEMYQKVSLARLRRNAQRALAKKDYSRAIDSVYSILSSNPDDIRYKKMLTRLYVQSGIDNVIKNHLNDAKTEFDLARILDPGDPTLKKHLMVVNRLLSGQIDRQQANEWFIFFQ